MGRIIEESHFADIKDEDLIKLIGSLWEHIKTIDETMRADQHIQQVEEKLKEYKIEKYLDEQKAYKLKLKASRAVAKARGLKFTIPKNEANDDEFES